MDQAIDRGVVECRNFTVEATTLLHMTRSCHMHRRCALAFVEGISPRDTPIGSRRAASRHRTPCRFQSAATMICVSFSLRLVSLAGRRMMLTRTRRGTRLPPPSAFCARTR